MEEVKTLRLFQEMRLHPWLPDHKLKIEARLAAMKVEDEKAYSKYRLAYDAKEKKYMESMKEVSETSETSEEKVDYDAMKKEDLVKIAKEKGIETKNLKKSELIDLISSQS